MNPNLVIQQDFGSGILPNTIDLDDNEGRIAPTTAITFLTGETLSYIEPPVDAPHILIFIFLDSNTNWTNAGNIRIEGNPIRRQSVYFTYDPRTKRYYPSVTNESTGAPSYITAQLGSGFDGSFNPVANTEYWIGVFTNYTPFPNSNTGYTFRSPVVGNISSACFTFLADTPGSDETFIPQISVGGDTVDLGPLTLDSIETFTLGENLELFVSPGSPVWLKLTTPDWATPPEGVIIFGTILIQPL